jgi:hypothetical protein
MQVHRFVNLVTITISLGVMSAAFAQSSAYFPLPNMRNELLPVIGQLNDPGKIRILLAGAGIDEEFSKRWAIKATAAANAGDTLAKYLFIGRGIYSFILSNAPHTPQYYPQETNEQLLTDAVNSGFPLAASVLLIQKVNKTPYNFYDPASCETTPEAKLLKDAALKGSYVASVFYQYVLDYGRSFATKGGDKDCSKKLALEYFSLMWASNTTKGVFIDQLGPFQDKLRTQAKSENWLAIEDTQKNIPLPAALKFMLSVLDLPTDPRLLQKEFSEAKSLRQKMESNMAQIISDDPRMSIFYKVD